MSTYGPSIKWWVPSTPEQRVTVGAVTITGPREVRVLREQSPGRMCIVEPTSGIHNDIQFVALEEELRPMGPHREAANGLRLDAENYRRGGSPDRAMVCAAVADLLDVHDDTGLNLTDFGAVTTLVRAVLAEEGAGELLNNGC